MSRGEGQWFTLPLPAAPGDFAAASLGDAPSHRAQARSYHRPFSTLFHRDFERTILPIKCLSVYRSSRNQLAGGLCAPILRLAPSRQSGFQTFSCPFAREAYYLNTASDDSPLHRPRPLPSGPAHVVCRKRGRSRFFRRQGPPAPH